MNKTYQELCDENQQLREGIRSMAIALEGGEWADMLTFDPDLGALESAIGRLVEDHNDARGIAIKCLNAALIGRNGRKQADKEEAQAARGSHESA